MEVGRAAAVRLGYSVTKVERAEVGKPGLIVGRRTSTWSSAGEGAEYTVTVRVTCSAGGAQFDAVTDEGLASRLDFRQRFATAVTAMIQQRAAYEKAQAERREAAGEQGLVIAVQPQRARDAAAAFGAGIGAGFTVVRVSVANRTPRTYGFARQNVVLVTQDGKRVAPLATKDVAPKLSPEVRSGLDEKLVADGDIPPGATRAGFLLYPASAYRRARVTVVDRENEETEGFSVDF
jgi:hypothetical protein